MAIQLGGQRTLVFRKGKGEKASRVRFTYREPKTDEVTGYLAEAMSIRKKKGLDSPEGMKAAFELRIKAALDIFEGADGFETNGTDLRDALKQYGSEYLIKLAQFAYEGIGDAELAEDDEVGKSESSPDSSSQEASAS